MKVLIIFAATIAFSSCGLIEHESHDGHKATSYQNIHIEHFHAVPTYVKKEDQHLLEHPISHGKTSAEVKVHHGGKHDHGYAIASSHSDLHDEGHDFGNHHQVISADQEEHHEYQPHYESQGHEEVQEQHYQVPEHHGYEGLGHHH